MSEILKAYHWCNYEFTFDPNALGEDINEIDKNLLNKLINQANKQKEKRPRLYI